MFLYNPIFPRQTLVNIEVKQNTFPFYEKKKCLKNHRINNTREGQSLKGLNLVSKTWGWVNCVQAKIFDDRAWKTFFLKDISRSVISWIDSEVTPHNLNTLTDHRGHSNGQGGKWDSDIPDLVSGLAADKSISLYLSCVVVSWLKKINQSEATEVGELTWHSCSHPKAKTELNMCWADKSW